MAHRVTRWRPDTCGCVLEYSWDDAVPVDKRVHTSETVQSCEFHDGHHKAVFDIVVEENQRKNRVVSRVHAQDPNLQDKVEWALDRDRVLRIKLSKSLTAAQRKSVRSVLDGEIGPKVRVDDD